jgi:hypothetical protein
MTFRIEETTSVKQKSINRKLNRQTDPVIREGVLRSQQPTTLLFLSPVRGKRWLFVLLILWYFCVRLFEVRGGCLFCWYCGLFCVRLFEVRGGCLFCWYWGNSCLFLFNFLFIKKYRKSEWQTFKSERKCLVSPASCMTVFGHNEGTSFAFIWNEWVIVVYNQVNNGSAISWWEQFDFRW